MEKNHINLQNAIARFPEYDPEEEVWNAINTKLGEQPLQSALAGLPSYEPDEKLWPLITANDKRQQRWKWSYAAAVVLVAAISATLLWSRQSQVAYSQEVVDERLQLENELQTDQQYKLLKAHCETETLVCRSREYQSLQQEYEILRSASRQLSQAMGDFNTEPELIRQYNEIERQKTDILNAMAKMI